MATLEDVRNKIDWEGFDYALTEYSTWKDVKDKKFQTLLQAYRKAHQALQDYLEVDEND